MGCLLLIAVYLLGGADLLPWDTRPGSPIGQSMGIVAGVVLLAILYYVPVRRADDASIAKPTAQTWHSVAGIIGTTLAILHSRAALREWSTLVLLTIIGLLVSGIYGRVVAPLRVGSTFGRSAIPYRAVDNGKPAGNESNKLIQAKRNLLKTLAPEGREGEFVLRWHHWKRNPRTALAYYRLVVAERRLLSGNPMSASNKIAPWERYWRRIHLWFAILFIVGLLAHIVTAVFFAGYVADGREIYWWHLTRW
ncbi:MAG: hypothetical protein HKN85_05135 [Gammaproteobacteria bacterium]|nr:hypothetical protein [Gammaproteobacteria bacterium]